ncbi:MAG: potassium channel protein [Planctomycetales bacterium]|nr:potassium channel protein [Planctomycetales bacterium]
MRTRIAKQKGGHDGARSWQQRELSLAIQSPIARIVNGLLITLAVVFCAVVGYVLHGWTWEDSFYMVVITISGVGYGEVNPVNTPVLRWITISLIVLGYIAALYTVGGFVQLVIDGELRRFWGVRRMQREIDRLNQHVVICGFGRMGRKLTEALATRGKPLIVIDQAETAVQEARSFGCLAIQGNATEEKILSAAGVERAAVLTTVLSDDVANLFITITAHELNPKLEIMARAEQTSTIKKLRQVGASRVILPANIGADRLANMILRPSAESLLKQAELPEGLNDDLLSIGLRLDELEVQPGSPLIGGTIADLKIHGTTPFLIVALRKAAGEVLLNPNRSMSLGLGDCVVILAHDEDIPRLCDRYALQSELSEGATGITPGSRPGTEAL